MSLLGAHKVEMEGADLKDKGEQMSGWIALIKAGEALLKKRGRRYCLGKNQAGF